MFQVAQAQNNGSQTLARQQSIDTSSRLSLTNIREQLVRLEDTIIFALIERAQYAHNESVYTTGIANPRFSLTALSAVLRTWIAILSAISQLNLEWQQNQLTTYNFHNPNLCKGCADTQFGSLTSYDVLQSCNPMLFQPMRFMPRYEDCVSQATTLMRIVGASVLPVWAVALKQSACNYETYVSPCIAKSRVSSTKRFTSHLFGEQLHGSKQRWLHLQTSSVSRKASTTINAAEPHPQVQTWDLMSLGCWTYSNPFWVARVGLDDSCSMVQGYCQSCTSLKALLSEGILACMIPWDRWKSSIYRVVLYPFAWMIV